MRAYKIVTRKDNKLYSYVEGTEFSLEYKVDEVTLPKIGKIFVFKDVLDALRFLFKEFYIYAEIWECEVDSLEKLEKMAFYSYYAESFWNTICCESCCDTPFGTYGCNELILKKQLFKFDLTRLTYVGN